MIYQDTWVNGKMTAKGVRSCETRYDLIKQHLSANPPKSVLDIGANMCYFGLRLIEDFNCSVMAFEYDHFDLRIANVKANDTNSLMLLNRKLSIPDLHILSQCCRFDLVLALSVLHHLPGDTSKWIEAMQCCGDSLIAEFALEDSTRPSVRANYALPFNAKLLGYGDSHLKKNFKRPIVLL